MHHFGGGDFVVLDRTLFYFSMQTRPTSIKSCLHESPLMSRRGLVNAWRSYRGMIASVAHLEMN